jgi:hypothetical protein
MPKTATPTKKAAAPAKATTPAQELPGDGWFVELDETVDYTNTLYYGREGSYKTTGAATLANLPGFPPHAKLIFINAEGGLKKKALQKRGVDTSRIVVWPDPKSGERINRINLDKLYRKIKAMLEEDPDSVIGVVFDSITEIHQAILDFVQEKRVDMIRNSGKPVDEDFVDIADYGTMSKMVRDLLRKFRDLPCHFVVTALERRDIDKDTGKPQYGPAVTPGLQTDLLGYVDFVIMCKAEDEDGPGRGLTRANSRYRAKDRFDVLPRVMAEPTMERIIGYLMDDITENDDPAQATLPAKAEKAQDKDADKDDSEDDTDSE